MKGFKIRTTVIIAAAFLFQCLIGGMGGFLQTAESHAKSLKYYTVDNERELKTYLKKSDRPVRLSGNISLESAVCLQDGKSHLIDLNGYGIYRHDLDKASLKGSVMILDHSSKLTVTDSAKEQSGKISGGFAPCGGGILVDGKSKLFMNGGVITENFAYEGAGIYIGKGSKARLWGVSISRNNYGNLTDSGEMDGTKPDPAIIKSGAKTVYGGGISVAAGGTCEVKNCNIHENASGDGGGIGNAGKITIEDSEIGNNILYQVHEECGEGAGIHSTGNTAMVNTKIVENGGEAENGGGIANYGTMTIEDCTVANNTVSANGGGIYIDYDTAGNHIEFHGVNTISDNAAKNGGGMYIADCGADTEYKHVIKQITFTHNTAKEKGGALYISPGLAEVTLKSVTMEGNKSETDGGAVMVSSPLLLDRCKLLLNKAGGKGGAVYADYDGSSCSLTITDAAIQDNSSSDAGGGIWLADDGKDADIILGGGKTVITMNTDSNNPESNIAFRSFRELPVTGKLDPGSMIGVLCSDSFGERTITKGYSDHNTEPADTYFVYDGPDHIVKQDKEVTEAVLVEGTNELYEYAKEESVSSSIFGKGNVKIWVGIIFLSVAVVTMGCMLFAKRKT